jgi:hypothetical protein
VAADLRLMDAAVFRPGRIRPVPGE